MMNLNMFLFDSTLFYFANIWFIVYCLLFIIIIIVYYLPIRYCIFRNSNFEFHICLMYYYYYYYIFYPQLLQGTNKNKN